MRLRSRTAGQHASNLALRDALLATSAAPTYFPALRVRLLHRDMAATSPHLDETVRREEPTSFAS